MTDSALLTDLYQLTMFQAYLEHGMDGEAAFEFFVRRLPPQRAYLLSCGLESVLEMLEAVRFSEQELDWLRRTGRFSGECIDQLAQFRFTGQVHAMEEGTPFFADEPILRVTAPLPAAQLVETRIINLLHYQVLVASKAARCVEVAGGRALVEFGLRRAHGGEAGLLAARAAYLAGFIGTSNVLAGMRWDIPIFGTMAHSFIQAHEDEDRAFMDFAASHPDHATMLIDTYDTEAAAARLGRLVEGGMALGGVRIDSGDLGALARSVRRILDAQGLERVTILASGDLDEHAIAGLRADGAPIDAFGVGTRVVTSADAPFLNCAYKLVAYAGRPRRKRSIGKATWPGVKQVVREVDAAGTPRGDRLQLADEPPQGGEPLLHEVMRGGRRLRPAPPLVELRAACARRLEALPSALRGIGPAGSGYPVSISPGLRALVARLEQDGG